MRRMAILLCAGIVSGAWAGTQPISYEDQVIPLGYSKQRVRVPSGYRLELLTADMDGPRLLAFAPNGDLFVGSHSGRVYRLPPPYTKPEVWVSLGDYPHSVAFRGKEVLLALTDGVYRAPYRPGAGRIDRSEVTLLAPLPAGGGHNSRTVGVGPDGRVYVSLGIASNCADQYLGKGYPFEDQRGGIMVLREAGGRASWEPYASGLRNPVGFAWQPGTGALYADNNGPDHWGYDLPPEYFVHVTPGSFFGMPWFQFDGTKLLRDDCIASPSPRPEADVTLPVASFPARSAPLGMAFVPPGALDPRLQGDAIVALHGSWGTRPSGGFSGDPATRRPPKLVVVRFKDGTAQRVDDLITGFQLPDGERWARPAGVAIGPDGALYFTSDSATDGLFRLKRRETAR
jgi:glucose/arabinose dehydrogenase